MSYNTEIDTDKLTPYWPDVHLQDSYSGFGITLGVEKHFNRFIISSDLTGRYAHVYYKDFINGDNKKGLFFDLGVNALYKIPFEKLYGSSLLSSIAVGPTYGIFANRKDQEIINSNIVNYTYHTFGGVLRLENKYFTFHFKYLINDVYLNAKWEEQLVFTISRNLLN